MTDREQIESRIVHDKLKTDAVMRPENGEIVIPHKALPYMLDLYKHMKDYVKLTDADMDTACMIYMFLADDFTFIPYLPLAVECYMSALKCASQSEDETLMGEIPELVYKIAKFRNIIARDRFYANNACLVQNTGNPENRVYDACEDIDTNGKITAAQIRELVNAAAETACRTLIASATEHTDEYLHLIYDMNESVFSNFSEEQKNDENFCHAYWAAKKMYLKSKGMKWETPAKLNPKLH
ncbi:MAG: hypothetical protein IJO93_04850 [Clostridia bacterium]|nr:hypothetical protein [Clostridia bacterium]